MIFSQEKYKDPNGIFSIHFFSTPEHIEQVDALVTVNQHLYYGDVFTEIVSISVLTEGFSEDIKDDIINAYISEFYYALETNFEKRKTINELNKKSGYEYYGEKDGNVILSWVFAYNKTIFHVAFIYYKEDYSKVKEELNSFFNSFMIL